MSYIITIDLWCPLTGCELDIESAPAEIFKAAQSLVGPKLLEILPLATLVWVGLKRSERLEGGEFRQGYALTLTINLAVEAGSLDSAQLRWLSVWVESHVAEALLELVNPMLVEDVSILRPWEFF